MKTKSHGNPCDDCGSSDALSVYDNGTYCYSCHTSHLHTRHRRLKTKAVIESLKHLPTYRQLDTDVLQWLMVRGIDSSLAHKYELSLAEDRRIVIPSYYYGQYLGYQGRGWLPQHDYAKYIQAKGSCPPIFASLSCRYQPVNSVVIVEDAFSAMVVGQIHPAIALCGTQLDCDGLKKALISQASKRYILWLDSDRAGREAARKINRELRSVGEIISIIVTDRDPKLLTRNDIREALR